MQQGQTYERYHRQMILGDFGEEAQLKLRKASILVAGAGGLGCPALLYLTGAGIGRIGIIDGDKVSLDNLHRQVIFTMDDIGQSKAEAAARRLSLLNPEIGFFAYPFRLTVPVCIDLFREYDVVLDCTDNFATRYMINDACVLLGKPLVSAAVSRYEGTLAVFNEQRETGATMNYRDIFPSPPKEGEVMSCAEAGILGMLAGMFGTMQAAEAFKLITGIGETLSDRMITYDMRENRFTELLMDSSMRNGKDAPADIETYLATDYALLCEGMREPGEIDAGEFERMLLEPGVQVIDVREEDELPAIEEFDHLRIPISVIDRSIGRIVAGKVLFVCQSGQRSRQAAALISRLMPHPPVTYSLRGGILGWKQAQKNK